MQYYLVRNPTHKTSEVVKLNGVIYTIDPDSEWIIFTDIDIEKTPKEVLIKRQIDFLACPSCGTDDHNTFESIPEFGIFCCHECNWESDEMIDSVWLRTKLIWTNAPSKLSSSKP